MLRFLLVVTVVITTQQKQAAAQSATSQIADLKKLSTVKWDDFPPRTFPAARMAEPASESALEKVRARLAKKRAPYIQAVIGKRFFGLAQITSIDPSERGDRFTVTAVKLLKGEDEPVNEEYWDNTRLQRRIEFTASEETALTLRVGRQSNVVGKIVDVSVFDWAKLHELLAARDTVVVIRLMDVKLSVTQ